MSNLLCLDATNVRRMATGCPAPQDCELYPSSAVLCHVIRTSLSCMPLIYCTVVIPLHTEPHCCIKTLLSSSLSSYCVNRDTLFSYHKASEEFLHRLMSLYVASHYKNTPNDLQLLSDAPAHHIFVLLGPVHPASTSLPEILCVLQVGCEGE